MLIVAMKGVFVVGVISWYSVAIMSMINDYFRTEFKEYMKKNPIASPAKADQKSPAIVISPPPIQQLVEIEKLFESNAITNDKQQQRVETNERLEWSSVERNAENGKMHCDHVNGREAVLMRLGGKSHHSYDVCAIDSSVNGWTGHFAGTRRQMETNPYMAN